MRSIKKKLFIWISYLVLIFSIKVLERIFKRYDLWTYDFSNSAEGAKQGNFQILIENVRYLRRKFWALILEIFAIILLSTSILYYIGYEVLNTAYLLRAAAIWLVTVGGLIGLNYHPFLEVPEYLSIENYRKKAEAVYRYVLLIIGGILVLISLVI